MDEGSGARHALLERLRQEEGSVDGSEVACSPLISRSTRPRDGPGPAVTYKWVVLSNTTIGTADRWQKRTGNEIEPPSH